MIQEHLALFETNKPDLKTLTVNKPTFQNVNSKTDENQQILISQTDKIKVKRIETWDGYSPRTSKNEKKVMHWSFFTLLGKEALTGKQRSKAQRISFL